MRSCAAVIAVSVIALPAAIVTPAERVVRRDDHQGGLSPRLLDDAFPLLYRYQHPAKHASYPGDVFLLNHFRYAYQNRQLVFEYLYTARAAYSEFTGPLTK
jgi:hypothetical protein